MEGTFCVVGGDGFVGSSLVRALLNRGFSVHATIFPAPTPYTPAKEELHYLKQIPGANERLKIFNADLRVENSYNLPIEGCQGVFVVASPLDLDSEDPEFSEQKEIVDVAVKGTVNVLKSCVKAKSVKRVVLTSSICAMSPLNEQGEMNTNSISLESFWSPVHYYRTNIEPFSIWHYFISKTLAEQTALSFAAQYDIDIVTIGPSVVGGPFMTPYIPGSVKALVISVLQGNEKLLMSAVKPIMSVFGTFPVVHITDVCNAHIFLMEQQRAQGRYLCSAHTLSITELAQLLTKHYPESKLTDKLHDVDSAFIPNTQFKSGKLTELGFSFKYGLEHIVHDCINCIKKLGLLTPE